MKLPDFGKQENVLLGKSSSSDRSMYEAARLRLQEAEAALRRASIAIRLINSTALREFALQHLKDNV